MYTRYLLVPQVLFKPLESIRVRRSMRKTRPLYSTCSCSQSAKSDSKDSCCFNNVILTMYQPVLFKFVSEASQYLPSVSLNKMFIYENFSDSGIEFAKRQAGSTDLHGGWCALSPRDATTSRTMSILFFAANQHRHKVIYLSKTRSRHDI